jgi:hypothetical protein
VLRVARLKRKAPSGLFYFSTRIFFVYLKLGTHHTIHIDRLTNSIVEVATQTTFATTPLALTAADKKYLTICQPFGWLIFTAPVIYSLRQSFCASL